MHHARYSPVENAVTLPECRYVKGTGRVVLATTGVGQPEAAQICIFGSAVTAAAPLRPRYHE